MPEIDAQAFEDAFKASRSYPGMGGLTLKWNPYECNWIAKIDFADNSRYEVIHDNATIALQEVAQKVHANPPRNT